MSAISIRVMVDADADGVAAVAAGTVGVGYFPPERVREYLARSTTEAGVFSYVATRGADVVGFRLVLPPGTWTRGRGRSLAPQCWPKPQAQAAYFQSCDVDASAMGQGIGGRLAQRAFEDLRAAGAKLVVTHSWKESPHNSSLRYLSKLGFVPVAEHAHYWSEVDYVCPRCGPPPCSCTAVECVLEL